MVAHIKGIFNKTLINLFETIYNTGKQKNTSSDIGAPLIDQAVMNSGLSLIRFDWDFNMAKGKGHLKVYHQTPLAGLKEVAWQPTNSTKVSEVKQRPQPF